MPVSPERPFQPRTSSRPDLAGKKSMPDFRAQTAEGNSKPLSNPTTPAPGVRPLARPPGTGPKTFEEMGVPTTKQDTECVSTWLSMVEVFAACWTDDGADCYVKLALTTSVLVGHLFFSRLKYRLSAWAFGYALYATWQDRTLLRSLYGTQCNA